MPSKSHIMGRGFVVHTPAAIAELKPVGAEKKERLLVMIQHDDVSRQNLGCSVVINCGKNLAIITPFSDHAPKGKERVVPISHLSTGLSKICVSPHIRHATDSSVGCKTSSQKDRQLESCIQQ